MFRFDMRLRDNPEFKALVNKEWKKARNMSVNDRINLIRSALTDWSERRYHNSRILTEQKKIELEEAMTDPINYTKLRKISNKLSAAYSAEEEHWRQQSQLLWLSLDD